MRNNERIQIGISWIRSPSSAFGRQLATLPLLISLSALVGCSIYPIPDDVTPLKTEEIVRHGRCEMRAAVIDRITQDKERLRKIFEKPMIHALVTKWFKDKNITPATMTKDKPIVALVHAINAIVEAQQEVNRKRYNQLLKNSAGMTSHELKKKLDDLQDYLRRQLGEKLGKAKELRQYFDVAVVYDFEFEITEENETKGDMAFKLPLISQTVDADASAALLLKRKGNRTFKTQDRWGRLISKEDLCPKEFPVSSKNVLYPLGGSIGVDRVVATFMDLIDQGGLKESFIDALAFTTDISGGVNATIKLSPVPHAFRLVSAGAGLSGSRVDVHKLTLSLAVTRQESSEAIFGVDRFDGDLDTPFNRPADWRARYNLCVADARAREENFKQLRQTAPEIYCIQYADAFDPQYGQPAKKDIGIAVKIDVNGKDKTGTKRMAPPSPPPPSRRPNFIPF